jgi:hypothetical protein
VNTVSPQQLICGLTRLSYCAKRRATILLCRSSGTTARHSTGDLLVLWALTRSLTQCPSTALIAGQTIPGKTIGANNGAGSTIDCTILSSAFLTNTSCIAPTTSTLMPTTTTLMPVVKATTAAASGALSNSRFGAARFDSCLCPR